MGMGDCSVNKVFKTNNTDLHLDPQHPGNKLGAVEHAFNIFARNTDTVLGRQTDHWDFLASLVK